MCECVCVYEHTHIVKMLIYTLSEISVRLGSCIQIIKYKFSVHKWRTEME